MMFSLNFPIHNKIKSLLKGSGFDELFEYLLKYGRLQSVKHCRPLMGALHKCFDREHIQSAKQKSILA